MPPPLIDCASTGTSPNPTISATKPARTHLITSAPRSLPPDLPPPPRPTPPPIVSVVPLTTRPPRRRAASVRGPALGAALPRGRDRWWLRCRLGGGNAEDSR